MPTYKLTVEYEGTRYRGWQTQTNTDRTVAGALEKALAEVAGEPIRIHGAGRTDAGVHALAQVAHFHAKKELSENEMLYGGNDRLPHDINILAAARVADTFHARHDATSRTYVYRISRRRSAFEKRYIWWVRDALDAKAMSGAAALFAGRHNFASFCENPAGQTSTEVVVNASAIDLEPDRIIFSVTASHFLWKMVRRLAGTLVEVGRGNLKESDVALLLQRPSREPAKWTAPPSGLFLAHVEYADKAAAQRKAR